MAARVREEARAQPKEERGAAGSRGRRVGAGAGQSPSAGPADITALRPSPPNTLSLQPDPPSPTTCPRAPSRGAARSGSRRDSGDGAVTAGQEPSASARAPARAPAVSPAVSARGAGTGPFQGRGGDPPGVGAARRGGGRGFSCTAASAFVAGPREAGGAGARQVRRTGPGRAGAAEKGMGQDGWRDPSGGLGTRAAGGGLAAGTSPSTPHLLPRSRWGGRGQVGAGSLRFLSVIRTP